MGLKTYVTFALGALCTRSAVACDEPDPETEGPGAPGIASVSFSGNGCATGTMDSNFTVGESITLGNFSTEISSTTSPLERTKNCQIHINFSGDNPPDYQLKVKDVALQGYLILESGASATVYVTSFWSQDASKTETTQQSLTNTEDLPRTEFVTTTSPVNDLWSPCNNSTTPGILNVNVRVAMAAQRKADNTTAYGYFGKYKVPTTDLSYPVQEKIEFEWRKCNATTVASRRSIARLNTQ